MARRFGLAGDMEGTQTATAARGISSRSDPQRPSTAFPRAGRDRPSRRLAPARSCRDKTRSPQLSLRATVRVMVARGRPARLLPPAPATAGVRFSGPLCANSGHSRAGRRTGQIVQSHTSVIGLRQPSLGPIRLNQINGGLHDFVICCLPPEVRDERDPEDCGDSGFGHCRL
jgi:hypothetical protein